MSNDLSFTIGNLIVLIFCLFFLVCIVTIPILIIKLLINLIKKTDYKNDCSNCPYYKDNNPDIEK
jgi:hypothetical protein